MCQTYGPTTWLLWMLYRFHMDCTGFFDMFLLFEYDLIGIIIVERYSHRVSAADVGKLQSYAIDAIAP